MFRVWDGLDIFESIEVTFGDQAGKGVCVGGGFFFGVFLDMPFKVPYPELEHAENDPVLPYDRQHYLRGTLLDEEATFVDPVPWQHLARLRVAHRRLRDTYHRMVAQDNILAERFGRLDRRTVRILRSLQCD